MMPEHSPVPLEACRAAKSDDQHQTVPTSRESARKRFGFVRFCTVPRARPELDVAKSGEISFRGGH